MPKRGPEGAEPVAQNPMTGEHLDALREALAGVIAVQKDLVSRVRGEELVDLLQRLEDLEARLESVGFAREALAVPVLATESLFVHEPESQGGVTRVTVTSGGAAAGRAGILFDSEEGREIGGLIYSAKHDGQHPRAWGLLTMDQYHQDQVIGVRYVEESGQRSAGFFVWERPEIDLNDLVSRLMEIQAMDEGPERDGAEDALYREGKMGPYWPTRLFAGRSKDGAVEVRLHDVDGRARLRLAVDEDGDSKIEFIDANGEVTKSITTNAG